MLEQLHNNTVAVALLLFILGSKIVISTEVSRQDNMLSQGRVMKAWSLIELESYNTEIISDSVTGP